MGQAVHNKTVLRIRGIANGVLRDLFQRGKTANVIRSMCVLCSRDAKLDLGRKQVLETSATLDRAGSTQQPAALNDSAGQAFRLQGCSPNFPEIAADFKFLNQLPTLSNADALGTLIGEFLDPEIDLSPAGIDNHAMGTVLEGLVHKFNGENNEGAGEHWTPRDAVRLMANLVFLPIEKDIKSGTHSCECPAAAEMYRSICHAD